MCLGQVCPSTKCFLYLWLPGLEEKEAARERWLQLRAMREARGRAWGLEVKSVKCLSREREDLSVPFLVGYTCNPKAWEAGIRQTPESHWPAGLVYLVNFRPMRDYVSKKKMGS